MRIFIFVHDLWPEIGHSRALIEKVNHLPNSTKSKIEELVLVCFTADNPQKIFPGIKCKKIFCPFKNIYPFLFKCHFFHLFSALVYALNKKRGDIFLSVGISSFFCDMVDVQFIHKDWSKHYFTQKKLTPISYIYKKILFFYLNFAEKIIYSRPKIQLIALSDFIKKSLDNNFRKNRPPSHLIYSSVNHSDFFVIDKNKNEIIKDHLKNYQELEKFDLQKPILLFVGAYERKGLETLLYALQFKSYQLVIIGKSEQGDDFQLPSGLEKNTIVRIHSTNQLNAFYNISDVFIFPTRYEPFGLVLLEAAMCGLEIFVPEKNVGASELLKKIPGINFMKEADSPLSLEKINVLDFKTRQNREKQRKEIIFSKDMTWKKAGVQLAKIIEEYLVLKN